MDVLDGVSVWFLFVIRFVGLILVVLRGYMLGFGVGIGDFCSKVYNFLFKMKN